jgi:uracil-DNA glycosylase family 4
MPKQVDNAALAPEHVEYRNDNYPELDDGQFIEQVCCGGLVLPEIDAGASWHMPACWLGDEAKEAMLPEDRRVQERQRLGWRPAQYLIILGAPNQLDIQRKRALHPLSDGGGLMRDELRSVGIPLTACVATYVTRFGLPRTVRQYAPKHKRAGLPFLQADIQHVNPDVIIACGADAVKALYGKDAKLDTVRGNVLTYNVNGREIPVIPTVSHLAFLGGYANIEVFRAEMRRAMEIANRVHSVKRRITDYRICKTAAEVVALCDEIRAAAPPYIAFDTEFGNDVAREEYNYTLSIQLAWGPGKAAFIQLRKQHQRDSFWVTEPFGKAKKDGTRKVRTKFIVPEPDCGLPMHSPEDLHTIWSTVQALLLDKKWKLAAHHLRVDVEQFARNGYPIDERIEDSYDTMLLHHLRYGDEDQGLDHVVRKYLPEFGAFWMELEEWLSANQRQKRLKHGYRDIPLPIITPYALQDADATWQVVPKVLADFEDHPGLLELYWSHVAPTSLHLLDVEREGLLVDEAVRAEMHDAYEPVYNELLSRLRGMINWPDFNPGSSDQMVALLFSDYPYRGKKLHKWDDGTEHLLPKGVRGLHLKPLYNTEKYPKPWELIEEAGETDLHAPSTKAAILDLLYHQNPGMQELRLLKHLSVVGKFLNSYLRPQELNEFGVPEDGDGFHCNIWRDGRVRTHLNQLTETGRYSSYKANLQTKPKKQEAAAFAALVDYQFGITVEQYEKRTFDGEKDDSGAWKKGKEPYSGADRIELKDRIAVPKFAKCFIARPGYVLIEADFKTAELFVWAYCSGDAKLIQVVDTGRDLHSEVAATAFNLPEAAELPGCIATLNAGDRTAYDNWCELIKHRHGALRVAAKSVNFGVMYGRGAAALMREINKVVKTPVTVQDTQRIIDSLAKGFPVAWRWLVDNSEDAIRNEYIANAFGRRRYFQGANQMGDFEKAAIRREAKNSPIQGCVADLLARAGYKMRRILKTLPPGTLDMRILLPVHDAFICEVKLEHVAKAINLLDLCMSKDNPIPGTTHSLGIDIEVLPHSWGDKGANPRKPGALKKLVEKLRAAA